MAYALALVVLWRALRPPGGGSDRKASRLLGVVLAAAWAWIGAVFFGRYLAAIDFMAPLYAAMFLVEALLLVAVGVRGPIAPNAMGPIAWAGVALLAHAIAGYPLSTALAGDDMTGTRVVFLAPGPTAVFTLGLLMLAAGRPPLSLAFVPVLWTLIGGASAWVLGVPEDLPLPLIGLGALALLVCKARRPAGAR